jgi:hypothetical protein
MAKNTKNGLYAKHGIEPDPPAEAETKPGPGKGQGRGGGKGDSAFTPGKGGGRGGGKPTGAEEAKPGKGDSNQSKPRDTPKTGSVSPNTAKVLDDAGLMLTGTLSVQMMSPRTDAYMRLCDQVYTTIVRVIPSAGRQLPRFVFMHCCKLFWARRLEDTHFAGTGAKPSAATRSPIPVKEIQVPMPIYDILMSIGVVTDEIHSLKYVPLPVLPDAAETENCCGDYLHHVLECVAFDWSKTWEPTENWLAQKGDDEHLHDQGGWEQKYDTLSELLDERNSLLTLIRTTEKALKTLSKDKDKPGRRLIRGGKLIRVFEDPDGKDAEEDVAVNADIKPFFDLGYTEWSDATRKILDLKSRIERFQAQAASNFLPQTGVKNDPGETQAYGAFLGASPHLWRAWTVFSTTAATAFSFSLSFPSDTDGTMTWIVPIQTVQGMHFGRLPRRDVAPVEWKLAVVIPLAAWDVSLSPGWTSNWVSFTSQLGIREKLIQKWINTFIAVITPTAESY